MAGLIRSVQADAGQLAAELEAKAVELRRQADQCVHDASILRGMAAIALTWQPRSPEDPAK